MALAVGVTCPIFLDAAGFGTAVPTFGVSVVALFARLTLAIAAFGQRNAGVARNRTTVAIFELAIFVAAVAVVNVTVVAFVGTIDAAVTALIQTFALFAG